MRKNYLQDRVGEPRDREDISWQFGCNLTCAGWKELPHLADKHGQVYQKGHCRIYLDNIGIFVYVPDTTKPSGWRCLFGQSFDVMCGLDANLLVSITSVDLMTGRMTVE